MPIAQTVLRCHRHQVVLAHDVALATASVALALYLRVGADILTIYNQALLYGMPTFAVIAGATFCGSGMYRGIWRYTSLPDLVAIVKATTFAILIFVAAMFLINRLGDMPRSVPAIQWFVLICILGGSRVTYRAFRSGRLGVLRVPRLSNGQVPVLVAGACDQAAMFIRAMNGTPDAPYHVVGILDDERMHSGRFLYNVQILGRTDDLAAVLDRLKGRGMRPQRIVIADASLELKGERLRALLAEAEARGLTVARLPSLVDFKQALAQNRLELRPVALEDLLGRPQAVLERSAICDLIAERRVLVTGAGGTIGGELARQIAALGPAELILLDSNEFNLYQIELDIRERLPDLQTRAVLCDIRDRQHLIRLFAERRPELVFHAAALKHVPLVEQNPSEGILTNLIGTSYVADVALGSGVLAMVQISTDKAVNPTSVMGASKRLAEYYCQALDVDGAGGGAVRRTSRFLTVRFGNVLGSSGSVVPLFQRQLARGGPLTVTHPEITRYFMTVREAVELVLQASAHGVKQPEQRGRIFVLDMGEPVRIVDVARQMIQLAGFRPDVDIPIAFVGLRPGEKLFEELFAPEEKRIDAAVDGVFVAASQPMGLESMRHLVEEMELACSRRDVTRLRSLMAEALPTYDGWTGEDGNGLALAPVDRPSSSVAPAEPSRQIGAVLGPPPEGRPPTRVVPQAS